VPQRSRLSHQGLSGRRVPRRQGRKGPWIPHRWGGPRSRGAVGV